jgi:hypothetical protein
MMTKKMSVLFLMTIISSYSFLLFGQDSSAYQQNNPKSMSFDGGIGFLSIRDEGISKERYTGLLPYYGFSYYKYNKNEISGKEFSFFLGREIKNYNMSAKIIHFYYRGYTISPKYHFSMFSKPGILFLGYNDNFFLHYRTQNIAKGGFAVYNAHSIFITHSLGLSASCHYQMHSKIQLKGIFHFGIISYACAGLVDPDKYDDALFKFTTFLDVIDSSVKLELQYQIHNRISASLGYQMYVNRITAWTYFLSANDNLFLTLNWHPKK